MVAVRRTLAEIRADASGRSFPELFRNQYLLEEDGARVIPGWSRKRLGGWTLHHGYALRVREIVDRDRAHVGFLLGHALTPDSRLVRDCLTIPERHDGAGFWPAAEQTVVGLSGRYLAIVLIPGAGRVLTDPVSDIPAIYDPATRRVGSSLGLVLDRPVARHPLFSPRAVLSGAQTLSFGQTLDPSVFRCCPNHALDLSDFSSRRFWPDGATVLRCGADEVETALDEIAARLSAHMAAWIGEFQCLLPVTGGRDSRTLLASAMGHLDGVHQFMAHRFNNNTRRDGKTGRMIMAELGYPFVQYFKGQASHRQMADMRLKMGWSGFRGELGALHSLERYPRDKIVLRGNIMELLRANQYRRDRLDDRVVHLAHAIRRTGVVTTDIARELPTWEPFYRAWFDTLPEPARARPYDLGFLELLLPNTQSSYCTAMHRGPFLNPFNDRRLIELAISIPPAVRVTGEVYEGVIRRRAPELLGLGFN